MLPDLKKSDDADPLIESIWAQFRMALRRSKAVLVLGHSLNDEAIINALTEDIDNKSRIAVALLGVDANASQLGAGGKELKEKVKSRLGGAVTTFPIHFGGEVRNEVWQSVREWHSMAISTSD